MTIIKQGLIYLIAEVFSKSIPFLMLPYFTRYLGSEGYGQIAIYQTLILLLVIFISLSIEGAISRYYFRYGRLSLGNLCLVGVGYNFFATLIIIMFISYAQLGIPIKLVLIASLQSLINVQLVINQCQKKAFRYLIIQILNGLVVNLIILFFFIILDESDVYAWIDASLYGHIFVAVISILFNRKFFIFKKYRSNTIRLYIVYLLSFGTPMIVHQISSFMRGHFDKILISGKFDMSTLGEYSVALQIASVISVIYMALNKAILPYYFGWLRKEKMCVYKIKSGIFKLLSVFIVPVLIYFLPSHVYDYILGISFVNIKYYILIFSIGFSLLPIYLLLVNYLFFLGKTFWISFSSILSSVIYILCVWFLGSVSIEYIPYAMIVGNISIICILYFMIFHTGICQRI